MKLAILLFGQPRFVDSDAVRESYANITNKYDCDFFCHCWWSEDEISYEVSSWSKLSNLPVQKNVKNTISKIYDPVEVKYEKSKNFSFPEDAKQFIDSKFSGNPHWNDRNYSNILSQLYSIQEVSRLFSAYSSNYDFVLLGRYDLTVENFPDLCSIDKNKFYLANHHPRFPDLVFLYGTKFLDWSANVFDDVKDVYPHVWEPSSESFKYYSFMRRFGKQDMVPCSMNGFAVRK